MNTVARAMCFCAFVFLFFGTSLATADEKLDIEVIATSAFHSMDNADLSLMKAQTVPSSTRRPATVWAFRYAIAVEISGQSKLNDLQQLKYV